MSFWNLNQSIIESIDQSEEKLNIYISEPSNLWTYVYLDCF